MLTIFATPKPFTGKAAIHQTNAYRSWAQAAPGLEVLIFGDSKGIPAKLGFKHYKDGCALSGGVPLLGSLFAVAQKKAKNDILMYSNSDVIIVSGLIPALEILDKEMPKFLGVCRRWDIRLDEPLDFTGDWKKTIEHCISHGGVLHSECSSDIFLFRRGLWELPPFAVGRPTWDNWMMWKAIEQQTPVVDLTPSLRLAHSIHLSGPGQDLAVQSFWDTDKLSQKNRQLITGKQQLCLSHVKKAGWLWELRPEGLVKCNP